MLTPQSADVIQNSVTEVAAHAFDITSTFYRRLFREHPDLMRVFNKSNQAMGDQQVALTAALVAYAVSLIDPDSIDFEPMMDRIANKHASLGVKSHDYTILSQHLFWAFREVMGEAATDELLAAWEEAYWIFASRLIDMEGDLYRQAGTDPAHPFRRYTVSERVEESDDVFSLFLQPEQGPLPAYRTGQYLSIAVDFPGGERQVRQYVISGQPRGTMFRVTIKRVPGEGTAPEGEVSSWLHENARTGTSLLVSQPAGTVVMDDSPAPLVLVSSGIGITPMAAILADLAARHPDRKVTLCHADVSAEQQPLRAEISGHAEKLADFTQHYCYDGESGSSAAESIDLTEVDVDPDATVFMCGPMEFMRSARQGLMAKGIPSERIIYEVFGPDLWMDNPIQPLLKP